MCVCVSVFVLSETSHILSKSSSIKIVIKSVFVFNVNLLTFFYFNLQLLSSEGIDCAYIYSALDQTARKINIGKFVHRKAMVLIVTDVAARGIDIPLLDNVINYNFPAKAKLFLHRVGMWLKHHVFYL